MFLTIWQMVLTLFATAMLLCAMEVAVLIAAHYISLLSRKAGK